MTDAFFKTLLSGKTSNAYDGIFSGSEIPRERPQEVELLKRQTDMLSVYGKALEAELIREEPVGNSLVRLVYLLKSEKAPTVWEFYFYRPKSDWFLINILFTDKALPLLSPIQ